MKHHPVKETVVGLMAPADKSAANVQANLNEKVQPAVPVALLITKLPVIGLALTAEVGVNLVNTLWGVLEKASRPSAKENVSEVEKTEEIISPTV